MVVAIAVVVFPIGLTLPEDPPAIEFKLPLEKPPGFEPPITPEDPPADGVPADVDEVAPKTLKTP